MSITLEKTEAIVSMVCITAIEITALSQGINGALLTVVVGILAGLGGYKLAKGE